MILEGDLPRIIEAALDVSAGPDHILPAGVTRYRKPLTDHDYLIADSMNQAAVDAILHKAVSETRRVMAPGARLYVMMGEWHAMPTHHMAQAGLLDNLAAYAPAPGSPHGALLYAYEAPYNDLQHYIRHHCALSVTEPVQERLHEHDPLGHYFARASMAFGSSPYAPRSLARAFNACVQQGIPLVLFDAARDETYGYLDLSGRLARDFAAARYQGLDLNQARFPVEGDEGTVIRNYVMAARIEDAARQQEADTVIVSVGLEHMGGNVKDNLSYETSLTAYLKQKIRPQDRVLPVFLSPKRDRKYKAENYAPSALWNDNPAALIIRGADESPYYNGCALGEEDRFIERLGKSYGCDIPSRFKAFTEPDQDAVRQELQNLIEQTGRVLPAPL